LKSPPGEDLGIRLDLESDLPFGIVNAKLAPTKELLSAKRPNRYANWSTLQELAELVRSDYKLPGLCLGAYKIGEEPHVAVAGLRNTDNQGATIAPDDGLLVGAIGKTMTATLIARFVDMKKLNWELTLGGLLPEIKMQESYKKVTISQLVNEQVVIPELVISPADLESLGGDSDSATAVRKAYVTQLLSQEPSASAGSGPGHSNAGYVVLGYVLEHTIRQSYEYLMEKYLFLPLKMNSAKIAPVGSEGQFGSAGRVVGHLLSDFGYAPYDQPLSKMDLIMAPAGGGVSCSIGDLLKFAAVHLNGVLGNAEFLSAESFSQLHALPTSSESSPSAGGWVLKPAFASETCHWQFGTNGTFYADITIWPKSKLAIVAFTNGGTIKQPSPTILAIQGIQDKISNTE
jgi:CubicO group peptidase (beta-lactamase class C family)